LTKYSKYSGLGAVRDLGAEVSWVAYPAFVWREARETPLTILGYLGVRPASGTPMLHHISAPRFVIQPRLDTACLLVNLNFYTTSQPDCLDMLLSPFIRSNWR